ncbi:MAG: peptide-methionine (R)-S-oxide reductase [Spirochaetaceae bacterium]|nr:MAG: peptide-methionine (R)-S-oxide reductase [Spirochaetaceae bacterium]
MIRRTPWIAGFSLALVVITAAVGIAAGRTESQPVRNQVPAGATVASPEEVRRYPIELSEAQWRERLTDFEYYVLREKGTERAFTGEYDGVYRPGIYYSRATGQPLFSSEHKYDSGTGWPSYWQPIHPDAVLYRNDDSLWMRRIEVVDSSSGSHLGHVFTDGPPPTGLRYCINSAALIFVAEGEEPPAIVRDYLARFGEI